MLPKDIVDQRIAIVGAGVAGSYLFRMLKKMGATSVDLFSQKEETACGIHSCAWMTGREFHGLISDIGLDPNKYIINEYDRLKLAGRIKKANILVIDKPRIISDMAQGAIRYETPDLSKYDRIIDSTGCARALLPPAQKHVARTVQYRILIDRPDMIEVFFTALGYIWLTPLGKGHFHLGCGGHILEPDAAIEELFDLSKMKQVCSCRSGINVAPPECCLPFVSDNIWGVGEAIGCVSPVFAEGIIQAMVSVRILLENWDNSQAYTTAILDSFKWAAAEYQALSSAQKMTVSIWKASHYFIYRRCLARYSVSLGPLECIRIIKQARRRKDSGR